MQEQPTLYKINRNTAAGQWINAETTRSTSGEGPHVLFCGGFHSNMYGNKARFLSELALREGWGFTRFDYLGHGDSDGDAEYCSLHDWLDDVLAVVDSLKGQLLLVGSSMGAWLAVHATLKRPARIHSLVTIAAAPDFTSRLLWPDLNIEQQQAIRNDLCVSVPTHYDGEDWRIRETLFTSGTELSLLDEKTSLNIRVPIRMLHGTADSDVPWSLSRELLDRCTESADANLRLIPGGDHRLSNDLALSELQRVITDLVQADDDQD